MIRIRRSDYTAFVLWVAYIIGLAAGLAYFFRIAG